MVAESGWFGSAQRPLFGWVHAPASETVRGGVVLCPSFGLEATFTYSTMRQLAERLAELGFVCVRFDYDGYGDSAGSTDDPDRVAAWQASVGRAIELTRSMTDRPLTVVGMRAGALLAAYEAQRQGGVDALVLWDAPRSGRSYLKELRTRHTVSFGDDPQESAALSFMGAEFAPDTVTALEALDLRRIERLPAERALSVQQPGRNALSQQARDLAGDALTVVEADDQNDLILRGQVPSDSLERAVDWLDRAFADTEYTKLAASRLADSTTAVGTHGHQITERVMALGPHRLFGIVTEPTLPESTVPADAPTMIFVPDAITPHIGLSRMWVELARTWAAAGLRVVRYDGSGNGDSEVRAGYRINTVAAFAHFDDVRDVAAAVSPNDPANVVFVGICSGAYQCAEAALELRPRGICVMNPAFSFVPAERPASRRRQARQMPRRWLSKPLARPVGALARRMSPNLKYEESFDWNVWFEACMWQQAVMRRTSKVPELAWRIVNQTVLNQLPADILRRIVDGGSDALVVCGDPDVHFFRLGARRAVAKLEQRPDFTLEHLPGLDHSVMKSGQRERIMAVLTKHVLARFGTPSPAAALTAPSPHGPSPHGPSAHGGPAATSTSPELGVLRA